ncbi:MAG: GHKL domain-containing protein [Deltaproteobacteria bacterium]|nr:GHKL domain-containing protein [Deltaproteobacteria bacterium]
MKPEYQSVESLLADKASQPEDPEVSRDAIARQKAQLEAIFSGFQDPLFILNPQYEILLANQTFITQSGVRSLEELKSRKCYQVRHGFERPCPGCAVTQTLLTGQAVSGERYVEDINQIHFQQAYPIYNEGGALTSIIQYSRDITGEKRLQEQLIQAEKLAGIGILASGVAHEINNPLTGILGLAEILQHTDSPTLRNQYLKEIIVYSGRIAEIVKDLSTYSRIPRSDAISSVNLQQALKDALRMVSRAAMFGDIEVTEDLMELEPIRASDSEIQQIFVNLISNAVEAMEGNGMLRLANRKTSRGLEVVIQDTGPGIAKETLKKIFDPFFTTKPPGQGTGLGLTVTHRLITKYRGSIEVESKEGRGTTFRVIFPFPRRPE